MSEVAVSNIATVKSKAVPARKTVGKKSSVQSDKTFLRTLQSVIEKSGKKVARHSDINRKSLLHPNTEKKSAHHSALGSKQKSPQGKSVMKKQADLNQAVQLPAGLKPEPQKIDDAHDTNDTDEKISETLLKSKKPEKENTKKNQLQSEEHQSQNIENPLRLEDSQRPNRIASAESPDSRNLSMPKTSFEAFASDTFNNLSSVSSDGRVIVEYKQKILQDESGMAKKSRNINRVSKAKSRQFIRSTVDAVQGKKTHLDVNPGNTFMLTETEMGIDEQPKTPLPSSAASALARKLKAQEGNEIVHQVKFIMNRAEAGEIRINLRPEALGKVRVMIQMEENRLSGRIFVESAAAREAFRNSLDALQTRLVESGFDSANLELSSDEHSFTDSRQNTGSRQKEREIANPAKVAKEFEEHIPTNIHSPDFRVNLIA